MRSEKAPRSPVPESSLLASTSTTMRPSRPRGAGSSSRPAMRRASPSTTAVLPTPGSPMRSGLFPLRLLRMSASASISLSRPTTRSIWPSTAMRLRLRPMRARSGNWDSRRMSFCRAARPSIESGAVVRLGCERFTVGGSAMGGRAGSVPCDRGGSGRCCCCRCASRSASRRPVSVGSSAALFTAMGPVRRVTGGSASGSSPARSSASSSSGSVSSSSSSSSSSSWSTTGGSGGCMTSGRRAPSGAALPTTA